MTREACPRDPSAACSASSAITAKERVHQVHPHRRLRDLQEAQEDERQPRFHDPRQGQSRCGRAPVRRGEAGHRGDREHLRHQAHRQGRHRSSPGELRDLRALTGRRRGMTAKREQLLSLLRGMQSAVVSFSGADSTLLRLCRGVRHPRPGSHRRLEIMPCREVDEAIETARSLECLS
ncbi:MAG: hypothetical protein MZV70_01215 [Desulfobacterales bacterium]|nr:hypothetical protein [Desulfobacterales bacterium]